MVTYRSEPSIINEVEQADGIIAVSPVFKASYSGLFVVLGPRKYDTLTGVPVN